MSSTSSAKIHQRAHELRRWTAALATISMPRPRRKAVVIFTPYHTSISQNRGIAGEIGVRLPKMGSRTFTTMQ